jgi:protease PrsW
MKKQKLYQNTWFLVFLSGLILVIATDMALVFTGNPNYLPTVILIGAFLVPVTFVIYIYQKVPSGEIPVGPIAITFLWGGALGTILAGVLEYNTLRQLSIFSLFGVGFIEEAAKLVIPIYFFFRKRYLHEADGLLFGIASGMGFAALETMGYGFVVFIQSQGNLSMLHQTLLIRGLLSPASHAAWTGIVCASLWRQRQKAGHSVLNFFIIGAFLLAVTLHSMWDIAGSISQATGSQFALVDIVGLVVVVSISLSLLLIRLKSAHHTSEKTAVINASLDSNRLAEKKP